MPEYSVMDLHKTVAETMAEHMPSKAQSAACGWMTERELQVYGTEYVRTGFQGGLNSYRLLSSPRYEWELNSYSGRTIDVPSCYIAGASEWASTRSRCIGNDAKKRMHAIAGCSLSEWCRTLSCGGTAGRG
jgi:hypothetical protein